MSKLISPTIRRILFLLLLIPGLMFFSSLHSNLQNIGAGAPVGENEENEAAVIEQYFQYRFDQMKDKSGQVPDGALIKALNEREAMVEQQASDQEAPVAGIDNASWTEAGPGNVGGRIRAILPIDASTVFIGGVSGGIWKTTNCCSTSTTWTSMDDFMANLAISSLIVDPTNPNVMYAGTGEGFLSGGAVRGAGVFKSTDGGTTWAQLSSTNNASWQYVNRLAISPNGTTLLAATRTDIFRSTDGGSTGTSVNTTDNLMDVRFDPADSKKAIAGGQYAKVFYSTNGGVTWSVPTGIPSSADWHARVELVYAPSNTAVVYASVGPLASVYKSTDCGQTYTLLNADSGYHAAASQSW